MSKKMTSGISFTKNTDPRHRTVYTNDEFFNDEIIYHDDGECLSFRKPTIDYRGPTLKPWSYKDQKSFRTSVVSDIPFGRYEWDEDSTEDEKIIYY